MPQDYSITISASIVPPISTTSIEMEVVQQATDKSPLRVLLSMLNESTESQQIDLGYTPPLSSYSLTNDSGSSTLILVPPNYSGCPDWSYIESKKSDYCWTAKESPEILETGSLISLNPKGKIEREYILLNHPSNKSCFPSGSYTTTDTIGIDASEHRIIIEVNVERCI